MKKFINGRYVAAENEKTPEIPYALKVEKLIRSRYSVSDELAILRQRESKPEEFNAYNGFCEICKAEAKKK